VRWDLLTDEKTLVSSSNFPGVELYDTWEAAVIAAYAHTLAGLKIDKDYPGRYFFKTERLSVL